MKIKFKKEQDFKLIFEADRLLNLKKDKFYMIKEYKKSRTISQNSLFWAILEEIQKETGTDKWELYLNLLEHTGILVEYLEAPHEAENTLKRLFRIVKKVENRISAKGKPTALYKVYVGSSQFNTNEMKQLIDSAIDLAESLGIQIDVETLESELE